MNVNRSRINGEHFVNATKQTLQTKIPIHLTHICVSVDISSFVESAVARSDVNRGRRVPENISRFI
jgi:hypothetical protein